MSEKLVNHLWESHRGAYEAHENRMRACGLIGSDGRVMTSEDVRLGRLPAFVSRELEELRGRVEKLEKFAPNCNSCIECEEENKSLRAQRDEQAQEIIRLLQENGRAIESRDIWREQSIEESKKRIKAEDEKDEAEKAWKFWQDEDKKQAEKVLQLQQEKGELAKALETANKWVNKKSNQITEMSCTISELREKLEAAQGRYEMVNVVRSQDASDAKLGALVRKIPYDWSLNRLELHNHDAWSCTMQSATIEYKCGEACTTTKTHPEKCIEMAIEIEAKNHE
jgi:hypothetical protein